jgi:hypothetical protein
MDATVEYKEYRIETEEKDGEWFTTIGRLDGLEVRSRAGGIVSTEPGQGLRRRMKPSTLHATSLMVAR